MRRVRSWFLWVAAGLLGGCTAASSPPARPSAPMPELRVQQRSGAEAPAPDAPHLDLSNEDGRVTLTATDADLRALLPLLAEAAGVSLVLGPDAGGTVSVHFQDMDAMAAIREVLEQAGLMIVAPLRPPARPTVFYTIPVNINAASVEEIQEHFGVSAEVARFIVENRVPPDGR